VNESWLTNRGDLVEVFPRIGIRGRRWYWHCASARNGKLLEWGEGYVNRQDCVRAAERHHPRLEDGFEPCPDCSHAQHMHDAPGCEWCDCEKTWAGEEE
jgi:hypothetical protein